MSNPTKSEVTHIVTPGGQPSGRNPGLPTVRTAEIAQASLAAHTQAAVQAKYVMAERRPRDEDLVRAKLLRDCQRPSFAASAMFRVPRGGRSIDGLSIRFAEAAIRAMGNIWCETFAVHDDETRRVVRVRVVDLENNTTHERDVAVEKVVERSRPGPQGSIGQRVNSQGRATFLVRCTEDEMGIKEAAQCSKALRTLMLRMVPGWLQEECREAILATQRSQDARDPDTAKRRILDSFSAINVMPNELVRYLGHPIEHCTPIELEDLRGVHSAVRDGELSWSGVLTERLEARGESGTKSNTSKTASREEDVMEKLNAK